MRTQNDGLFVAGDRTAQMPPVFVVPKVTGTPSERAAAVYAAVNKVYEKGSN